MNYVLVSRFSYRPWSVMIKQPALTLEGALSTLGHGDDRVVRRLSKALGVTMLASGAVAGAAAVGPAGLAPLAFVQPLWGWIDQKNEAMSLLANLRGTFRKRVEKAQPRDRQTLVAAAHTAIVVDSFFSSLRLSIGDEKFALLEITESEKRGLVNSSQVREANQSLYSSAIPFPSPGKGFEENLQDVQEWFEKFAERVLVFLSGLSSWPKEVSDLEDLPERAVQLYRELYAQLASAAPEMEMWAALGEHSATREQVRVVSAELQEVLGRHSVSLGRVEELLTLTSSNRLVQSDPELALRRCNLGRLDQPIITQPEIDGTTAGVRFPTVREVFVPPKYRIAVAGPQARPSDENWWAVQQELPDLEMRIASFATSMHSARVPLLLLGHPGAGKSMLMKVLAAHLPVADYACVLVPLRSVSVNAPILDQIQQALDISTNRRVQWHDLADRGATAIRVLILDGLDELLQASHADRSAFLQEVMEFQRVEAEQERPVVAIVTSRTVVADRVEVPEGTVIVKLEPFGEQEIDRWLEVWNRTNAENIEQGKIKGLTAGAALTQRELAAQPLLLLMLAIYSADLTSAPLDKSTTVTELYRQIIHSFSRREILKDSVASPEDLESGIESHFERLSVAALSMFNRGAQSVHERDLSNDLISLNGGRSVQDYTDPGRRLLAEFFFMHTAESQIFGSEASAASTDRAYEFLHATFGEFLVAYRVVEELRDIADRAYAGRKKHDPADDFLFAILRHQALAGRVTIISFVSDLIFGLERGERESIRRSLYYFAARYRRTSRSDQYASYQPIELDDVRGAACYSANLVGLCVASHESDRLPLEELFAGSEDAAAEWGRTVALWRAGLDSDAWQAMANSLSLESGSLVASESFITSDLDYQHARLVGDRERMARVRHGRAINDNDFISDPFDDVGSLLSQLHATIVGRGGELSHVLPLDSSGLSSREAEIVVGDLERLLLMRQASDELCARLIRTVIAVGGLSEVDPLVLMVNICRFPTLLDLVPELMDPEVYAGRPGLLLLARMIPRVPSVYSRNGSEDPEGRAKSERSAIRRLRTLFRKIELRVPDEKVIWDALSPVARELIGNIVVTIRDDRWDPEGLEHRFGSDAIRAYQ